MNGYETLSVTLDRGVLFATVNHPPCNVLSVTMMLELTRLATDIAHDDGVRVVVPAGSGTQNLTRLMGRGRALEMILGAEDIDAETAASWGYLNRVFDSTDEMNERVDALAFRIATWPPYAVALAKEAVGNADLPWKEGLLEEHALGLRTLHHPEAKRSLRTFLECGGETVKGERRVADLSHEVAAIVRSAMDERT